MKGIETRHIPTAFILALLSSSRGIFGEDVKISTASKLIEFANSVNNGGNYTGSTVFLDSDIEFTDELSQQFEPIGKDSAHCFKGTFDGQGYAIRNLKVNSSFVNVGLFGYSSGQITRNVVIDSSCSIKTSTKEHYSDIYIGGIIGSCSSSKGPCAIESCVNMGSITGIPYDFNDLSLGGIAGRLDFSYFFNSVKNCANYGSVRYSGDSSRKLYLGGVVGFFHGGSTGDKLLIRNCFNYGSIIYDGTATTSNLNDCDIGGIAGRIEHGIIENSLNVGDISSTLQKKCIGAIVGLLGTKSTLSHCYWDGNSSFAVYGSQSDATVIESPSFNENFILSETVSIGSYKGTSLIDALNAFSDYYSLEPTSHWILNKGRHDVSFTVGGNKMLSLDAKMALLPDLAGEGRKVFDGWYTDSAYTVPLAYYKIDNSLSLYGRFEEDNNDYTITFETRAGFSVAEPITARYLTVVALPNSGRGSSKYVIAFWETRQGYRVPWNFTVPAHNITLYASLLHVRISDAREFIEFANDVNNGGNYTASTVFLDSDIEFTDELSREFEPIGRDPAHCFKGTFDGQGYAIRNLKVNSSLANVGLFGYSSGQVTRNVVIDSSCSIESSFGHVTNAEVDVGGIIGSCTSATMPCNIENCVNMGNVTFDGSSTGTNELHLGGICGHLRSSGTVVPFMRNCANYGLITHGFTTTSAYAGGIVGRGFGSSSAYLHIQNCFNYGSTICRPGKMGSSIIGGIAGYVSYVFVENCVSAGTIVFTNQTGTVKPIGSIAGFCASSNANHTFWASNVNYSVCGQKSMGKANETGLVELSLDTVMELRSFSEARSWNKWVFNKNNASVTFKVGSTRGFTLNSQVMVLPDPASSSEHIFCGWYKDEKRTMIFTEAEVVSATTLYGKASALVYVVTFDVNGGDEFPWAEIIVEPNGTYGYLLAPTRAGHTFLGWFTDDGKVVTNETVVTIERDHTLHAHWSVNNYTVTFDANGGDELAVKEITVTFNMTYGPLPTPNRSGFTFKGWFTDEKDPIVSSSTVRIPRDHTLRAEWVEIESEKVEIIFVSSGLGKKDVEAFVRQYTDAKFDIIKIENHEPDGKRAVVKFGELKDAVEFVGAVRASSDAKGVVKKIGYAPNESFSVTLCPASLAITLFVLFSSN